MLNYKIKKKSKVTADSIIEVSGIIREFSVMEVYDNIKSLEKLKRELEPMLKVYEAKITNIVNNHPEVLKLSEDMLVAAYLYNEASVFVKEAKKKLKEVDKQLKVQKKDLKDIAEQTGLELWLKK